MVCQSLNQMRLIYDQKGSLHHKKDFVHVVSVTYVTVTAL